MVGGGRNNETRNVQVPFLAASSACWQSSYYYTRIVSRCRTRCADDSHRAPSSAHRRD